MLTGGDSGIRAYCQSKLARIMFTIDLGAALEGTGVTVTCLHPPLTWIRPWCDELA
jgi:NAD(P)-dependent dehydrogenase (short-subunit alcohol dehydrogenase family)